MRNLFGSISFWTAVAVAGLLLAWAGDSHVPAIANEAVAGGGQANTLITHFQNAENGPTRVVVVDPFKQVMAVYFVARDNGEIQLKSVRSIASDLQFPEFNTAKPWPSEIRDSIERHNQ